jgi:hypothetical protein
MLGGGMHRVQCICQQGNRECNLIETSRMLGKISRGRMGAGSRSRCWKYRSLLPFCIRAVFIAAQPKTAVRKKSMIYANPIDPVNSDSKITKHADVTSLKCENWSLSLEGPEK